MKTKVWLTVLGVSCLALAIWLAVTGVLVGLTHGRLTASVWALWLAIILLRGLKDRLWPAAGDDTLQRAWMRLPLNIVLALMPGLSLVWFSLFAPNTPSITESGLDVCALETGLCLSGPRSVIVWAVILVSIGLVSIWLIWPGRGQKVVK
jgi:hypothetical protein